jgi:hypothetical protein
MKAILPLNCPVASAHPDMPTITMARNPQKITQRNAVVRARRTGAGSAVNPADACSSWRLAAASLRAADAPARSISLAKTAVNASDPASSA